jgi:elongation factor Ts
MPLTTDVIKELRDKTGVSVMQCKKALEEAEGDLEKAESILRERSAAAAQMKVGRELGAGAIGVYTHEGAIGALVLLSSETDFVAKNPEFLTLARELAMQVAAMGPEGVPELLPQPYIKDGGKTVQDLLNEASQKFGERVEVSALSRLSVR